MKSLCLLLFKNLLFIVFFCCLNCKCHIFVFVVIPEMNDKNSLGREVGVTLYERLSSV